MHVCVRPPPGVGMENVWCDTRTEDSSQRFVLWAGAVLELREEIAEALQGRSFAFSLLVHSDQGSPMLDFLPSSSVLQVCVWGFYGALPVRVGCFCESWDGLCVLAAAGHVQGCTAAYHLCAPAVASSLGSLGPAGHLPGASQVARLQSPCLQVRSDCPPSYLLDFLHSEAGAAADVAASQLADSRHEEEALLEEVRHALGARHVIRVCSSYDQDKVTAAARRLIDNAPAIRTAVNLAGGCTRAQRSRRVLRAFAVAHPAGGCRRQEP